MFSCQTQVSGCVLLTPRHIWLRHIWLPREGARSAIRPDKPFRFGDVLCSGGGLSRWPRRAGACPPQVVPSSGQGNDAAKVLAGMRPHRSRLCPSAPVSGGCNGPALGYQWWGNASFPDPSAVPSAGGPGQGQGEAVPGRGMHFSQPCSGRDVPSPSALSSRGRTLPSLPPRPAAEGVNGAQQVLVSVPPRQRGGVRFDTPLSFLPPPLLQPTLSGCTVPFCAL